MTGRPTIKFKCLACEKVLSSRPNMRHHLLKLHDIPNMNCDHYSLVWLKPKDPLTIATPQSQLGTISSPPVMPKFQTPLVRNIESDIVLDTTSQPTTSAPEDVAGLAPVLPTPSPSNLEKPGKGIGKTPKKKVGKKVKEKKGFDYFKELTSAAEMQMESFKLYKSKTVKNQVSSSLIDSLPDTTTSPQPMQHNSKPTQQIHSPQENGPVMQPQPVAPPTQSGPPYPVLTTSIPSTPSGTLSAPAERAVRDLAKQKQKQKIRRRCENPQCEPCSVLENCHICYYCLNRSKLR